MSTVHTVLLAFTIYMEAQGEGPKGMSMVASVINNAAKRHRISPVAEAIRFNPKNKVHRYSCWGHRVNKIEWIENQILPLDDPNWDYAMQTARELLSGRFDSITKADHYHGVKITPVWAKKMEFCTVVGGHVFWRAR